MARQESKKKLKKHDTDLEVPQEIHTNNEENIEHRMTFKTEEMEMIPVPFSGQADSDPHSERFVSDLEEGVILLPQKDRIRHSQGKLSLTDLAQIHAE